MLPDHLFVSHDGALYDTRDPKWAVKAPLRAMYRYHYSEIKRASQFKATVRAGKYAWPGGYPLYFICDDGEAVCFDCAKKEAHNVLSALNDKRSDGWRVTGCDVNYEDADLPCAACGNKIEVAYPS